MNTLLPPYQNIINQGAALGESIAWHYGPGRASLQNAAELLNRASQIVVVAIGASYNAAIPFTYRLAAAGKRVVLEDAAEFVHFTHTAYPNPTLFLLVSRSGSTIEILRSLERLQRRGHTIVGVTNVPESPLALQSDLALIFGGPNDHLIAVQTYQTTLLTLDLLAEAALADMDSPQFKGELHALTAQVQQMIDSYRRVETQPFQYHDVCSFYLLGRGASLGSANQGVLMFHEMARHPAMVFSAGAFRHGLWEVVEERRPMFVFAPSDAVWELNLALVADLAGLHAEVSLLSSRPLAEPGWRGVQLWQLPDMPARWAPYFEIIPIQFYVFGFSLWKGLTPGVFRASFPVITSETGRLADDRK